MFSFVVRCCRCSYVKISSWAFYKLHTFKLLIIHEGFALFKIHRVSKRFSEVEDFGKVRCSLHLVKSMVFCGVFVKDDSDLRRNRLCQIEKVDFTFISNIVTIHTQELMSKMSAWSTAYIGKWKKSVKCAVCSVTRNKIRNKTEWNEESKTEAV